MDIHAEVKGAREVGLRFEEFPDGLYNDLRNEVEGLTDELYGLIQAATPVRTGKLRTEETRRVYADPQHIKGEITVAGAAGDLAKAGALEYGAHRPTQVSSHQMRLDHAWGDAFSAPESVLVAAYTRTPNVEEYAFERGPLGGMSGAILAGLEAAVERAVGEANR